MHKNRIIIAYLILLSGLVLMPQTNLFAETMNWQRYTGLYETPTPTPTNTSDDNCTYGQGYWKNHPDAWPVNQLVLGDTEYSQDELLEIFDTPPQGDATYILAYQLIAAKLNVANGADEEIIAETIAAADQWLIENELGSDPDDPARAEGIKYADALENYNNGMIGPGGCGGSNGTPTPTPVVTNTPTPEPSEVITLEATGGLSSINVEWTVTDTLPGDLDSYNLYRGENQARGEEAAEQMDLIGNTQSSQYTDNDPSLMAGVEYCYQVEAIDAKNEVIGVSNVDCATLGELTLWVPDQVAQPDATDVLVPINLSNGNGLCIGAINITVSYSDTIVSATGTVSPTIYTENYAFIANTNVPGQVKIASITTECEELYGGGSLFIVGFDVIGDEGDVSPLDFIEGLTSTVLYDDQNLITPVDLVLQNGSLTIGLNFILGDVNGDGVVNAADALLALKIASEQVEATAQQLGACDVNGDGSCNSADSSLILCYAAFGDWQTCLGTPTHLRESDLQGDVVELAIGDVTETDNSITATVEITNGFDLAGSDFTFVYDASKMTPSGVSQTSLTEGFLVETNLEQDGLLRVSLASNEPIAADGAILELEFNVNSGNSNIAFGNARLHDASGRDFETSALQRQVDFVPYVQSPTAMQLSELQTQNQRGLYGFLLPLGLVLSVLAAAFIRRHR